MFNAQEMSKIAKERANISVIPSDIIMSIENTAKNGKFATTIERYSNILGQINDDVIKHLRLLGFTVDINERKWEDRPGETTTDMLDAIIHTYTISWPM